MFDTNAKNSISVLIFVYKYDSISLSNIVQCRIQKTHGGGDYFQKRERKSKYFSAAYADINPSDLIIQKQLS